MSKEGEAATNPAGLTDEEMAGLSEEEKAALAEPEDDADTLADIADGGDDEDDPDFGKHVENADDKDGEQASAEGEEGEEGDGKGKEGEEGKDGKGEEGDEQAAAAADGEEAETDEDRAFVPKLHAEEIKDAQTQLDALTQQKADLRKQYADGDLTLDELMAKTDEVNGQITDLTVRVRQAEFAANNNKANAQARWEEDQEEFYGDHPEYDETKNPAMWGALNETVKSLAREETSAGRSGRWILNEAHKRVQKVLKGETPAAEDGGAGDGANKGGKPDKGADAGKIEDKGKQAGTKGKKPVKPDMKGVPQTLSGLPAAAGSEVSGGEFDYLEKLSGVEYEAALAKLSPEQQARYLKG